MTKVMQKLNLGVESLYYHSANGIPPEADQIPRSAASVAPLLGLALRFRRLPSASREWSGFFADSGQP
jgi:hypothetical protein